MSYHQENISSSILQDQVSKTKISSSTIEDKEVQKQISSSNIDNEEIKIYSNDEIETSAIEIETSSTIEDIEILSIMLDEEFSQKCLEYDEEFKNQMEKSQYN